jgi:hypothetical protein
MRKCTLRPKYVASLVAAVLVLVLPLGVGADEGFWPFNRIPKAAIKHAYGVELSDAWLNRVQQASVRFPSGSGSFVSPDGLVLTNHHVAMEIIQELSTAQNDYVKNGFVAQDRSQELRAPDLELVVLQAIEDVTGKVNANVTPAMSSSETLAARRATMAAIEKEAEEKTKLQTEIVTLYQGAQYHLYLYKKYTDVRLVFAPVVDHGRYCLTCSGLPSSYTRKSDISRQ